MRANITYIFILCLFGVTAMAQAPQGINYQGVARGMDGQALSQKEIAIRIAILNQSADGNIEYNEIHELKTNQFGLFTLMIGKGTSGTGSFNSIDWSSGNKWVQIELDENGGRNFQLMGSQQLMSVPYALYAERAGSGYQAGRGIGINNNMITNLGDEDNSSTNELITSVVFASDNKLRITDAGGTKEADLSALVGAAQNLESVLAQGNGAGNNSITNLGTPVNASDAATKAYVDAHVDGDASSTNEIQNLSQVLAQSNNAGGAKITNLGTPTVNSDATTKLYVDNLDAADGDKSATNEIQNLSHVLTQNNSAGGTKITNLGTPTVNSDATTKLYVDNLDAADGDKSATNEIQNLSQVLTQSNNAGGTKITNLGTPTANSDATTKLYVDNLDAADGDKNATNEIQNLSQVLTQNNSAGGTKITNLGTPTVASDATTKSYVDNADDALSARINNTYAFKATFDYQNLSGLVVNDQIMPFISEDFDDFSVLGPTTFTANEEGTYVFIVYGYYNTLIAGGSLSLFYNSVKYPITIVQPFGATQPRFSGTFMFKLTAGQTVSLVGDNIALLAQFNGKFFGFKL